MGERTEAPKPIRFVRKPRKLNRLPKSKHYCTTCGELLSSPPKHYTCPNKPEK
jgi:hypothetical protein